MITVSFLYVHTDGQVYTQSLAMQENTSLKSAIIATGWLTLPEFSTFKTWLDNTDDNTTPNQKAWHVGVWSVKKPLDYLLQEGDRVEFYRPLSDDPMKKRQSKVLIAKKKQARLISQPRLRRNK